MRSPSAPQQGHGTALLLVGEPGIGKTMLLDDLEREQGTAMTILRAAGGESTADLPFMALKTLLLPVEKHFDALPAPQAKALRLALGLDEPGAGVDRLSVTVAVRGALGRAAGRRPVLAIVDDAQWLDEPSRSTVLFVARQLQDVPIAMVIACRSGELPESETRGLPRLELQGLRRRDAQAVLDSTARAPVATAVRRRLLELAAGNPLALAELPRALSDDQLTGAEPLGEPVPVNGGVERAFGTRIARLPERSRQALLLLAAAGEDATETVTAALRREGLERRPISSLPRQQVSSPGTAQIGRSVIRWSVRSRTSSSRRRSAARPTPRLPRASGAPTVERGTARRLPGKPTRRSQRRSRRPLAERSPAARPAPPRLPSKLLHDSRRTIRRAGFAWPAQRGLLTARETSSARSAYRGRRAR